MAAPVTKLDADQYMAEDLDGITESVFGSGNLNFLLMQAGQTNEAIALINPFMIPVEAPGSSTGLASGISFASLSGGTDNSYALNPEGPDTNTDRAIAEDSNPFSDTGTGGGGSMASTVLPVAASGFGLSGDALGALSPVTDSFDGIDGTSGTSGMNGTIGTSGTNGSDGSGLNILNEVTNLIDQVTNLDDSIFEGDLIEEVMEVVNDLSIFTTNIVDILENTEILNFLNQTILGDTINDATDWLTNTVNNVTNTTNEAVDVVNNILTDIIGDGNLVTNITEIISNPADVITNVTNLIDSLDIGDLVTEIVSTTTTTTTTTDLINNLLGNDDGTDSEVQLASNIDLGIAGLESLDPVLDILGNNDLQLDIVEDLVGDIDLGTGIGLDLLGQAGSETDNNAGDSDLTPDLDLGLIDNDILGGDSGISLDFLEDITGDLDLDLNLGGNILGNLADPIVNGDEGGTGDETSPLGMLGDALADSGGTLFDTLDGEGNEGGDILFGTDNGLIENALFDTNTDIALDIVENLFGQDVDVDSDEILAGDSLLDDLNIDMIDAPIDPVQDILDSLDLDISEASDLLNPILSNSGLSDLVGGNTNGNDILAWPENTLPDPGDIFGGGADSLGGILPEPVGDVTEGLGGLLSGGNQQPGGLFGGGGLFG